MKTHIFLAGAIALAFAAGTAALPSLADAAQQMHGGGGHGGGGHGGGGYHGGGGHGGGYHGGGYHGGGGRGGYHGGGYHGGGVYYGGGGVYYGGVCGPMQVVLGLCGPYGY